MSQEPKDAEELRKPEPTQDPPSPPLKDPPDQPMHDPAGDLSYEPQQPFGDFAPMPGQDPPPETPQAAGMRSR